MGKGKGKGVTPVKIEAVVCVEWATRWRECGSIPAGVRCARVVEPWACVSARVGLGAPLVAQCIAHFLPPPLPFPPHHPCCVAPVHTGVSPRHHRPGVPGSGPRHGRVHGCVSDDQVEETLHACYKVRNVVSHTGQPEKLACLVTLAEWLQVEEGTLRRARTELRRTLGGVERIADAFEAEVRAYAELAPSVRVHSVRAAPGVQRRACTLCACTLCACTLCACTLCACTLCACALCACIHKTRHSPSPFFHHTLCPFPPPSTTVTVQTFTTTCLRTWWSPCR